MQDGNDAVVKERAENLNMMVMEKLQELETIHDKILDGAKRRVEQGKLDKIKRQFSS